MPISHSAIAGMPSGEIKNEIIRKTIQPVVVPAKNKMILTKIPIPQAISKSTDAVQNRNVNSGAIIVRATMNGRAIILNISLNGFM